MSEICEICSESKCEHIQDSYNAMEHFRKTEQNEPLYPHVAFREGYLKGQSAALKEQAELVEACKAIEKWWDVSDIENIQPAIEPGNPLNVRNDSMAAGAIHRVIVALKKLKAKGGV